MKTERPIALLTDFGSGDAYVGSVKAVILSLNPNATIFDITHEIGPQNVRQAAFVLRTVTPFLPPHTICVAVVDPGVGSSRKAICIKSGDRYFVGPDNGIFSWCFPDEREGFEVRSIENSRYFLRKVSTTFHGRDIFGPVAAHLSLRDIFPRIGPTQAEYLRLEWPALKRGAAVIQGTVVYIDKFGNAITNIPQNELAMAEVLIKVESQSGVHSARFCHSFSNGIEGELIAVVNSSGLLELAVKNESAQIKFQLSLGDLISVGRE